MAPEQSDRPFFCGQTYVHPAHSMSDLGTCGGYTEDQLRTAQSIGARVQQVDDDDDVVDAVIVEPGPFYNPSYSCFESGHIMGPWYARTKGSHHRSCVIPTCDWAEQRTAAKA